MKKNNSIIYIEGKKKSLPVHSNDKIAIKIAMIFECQILGKKPEETAKKYGYSKQRYYQVLHKYLQGGTKALIEQKPGPVKNRIRTDNVINQIIRHKFLDPDATAEVIAQKLRQTGIKISKRSVERTITDQGLQKKTSFVRSSKVKNK